MRLCACLFPAPQEVAAYDKLPVHRAERLICGSSDLRANLIKEVYAYWEAKRKKADKPLIACFQLPTDPNDNDPVICWARRQQNHPATPVSASWC